MMKKKRLNPTSTVSGFTLLETLVVIIMVGILMAIAAPGWLGYLNRQRASRATNELAQALQKAQADAQQQSDPRFVRISSINPPRLDVSGKIVELGDQNEGLSIDAAPAASVTFDIKGAVDQVFIFSVTSDQLGPSQNSCVMVTTLLGSIVQAKGDDCDLGQYILN